MRSSTDSKSDNILIVAAEASSCMYAKNLIKAWLKKHPNDHFFGVGDSEMEDLGVDCMGYAEEMAVVGLFEVLKHWKTISGCFRAIEEEVSKRRPKFAILLDYPGFNLRLARKLKAQGVEVVYYISPQLWAWKKGRVKQVRDFVDHMLVVFPFEVDFYKQHGIDAHFVGHPLVEVVQQETSVIVPQSKSSQVLGLMPGSRKSEIQFNLATQLEAAKKLTEQFANLEVHLLLAPTLTKNDLVEVVERSGTKVTWVQDEPTKMIEACNFILTASGTATLQVALCKKPMVVMYRMNALTAWLAKRLVKSVEYFCIVNLIAGRQVVPEFFQDEANPGQLAGALAGLMLDSNAYQTMIKNLESVSQDLGGGSATKNVVKYLETLKAGS